MRSEQMHLHPARPARLAPASSVSFYDRVVYVSSAFHLYPILILLYSRTNIRIAREQEFRGAFAHGRPVFRKSILSLIHACE